MLRLRDDACTYEISFLTVPNHLRAADSAERTKRREQINRFEDIRFPLCVISENDMEARRKIDVHPRVIAEVAKSQMRQVHKRIKD